MNNKCDKVIVLALSVIMSFSLPAKESRGAPQSTPKDSGQKIKCVPNSEYLADGPDKTAEKLLGELYKNDKKYFPVRATFYYKSAEINKKKVELVCVVFDHVPIIQIEESGRLLI
jgi:Tfp pilus assembly protein PilF